MSDYSFKIPAALNGNQLRDELGVEKVWIDGDLLWIRGDITEATASAGIAAHKPAVLTELTIEDKLAKLGITADEFKTLLGGN